MKSSLKSIILTTFLASVTMNTTAISATSSSTEQAVETKIQDSVILKKIVINGSGRLSDVAIIAFMSFREGDDISSNDEAGIIKELYETQKFKSVKVVLKNSILYIDVVENAIVNNFIFKGNKVVKDSDLMKVVGVKVLSVNTRSTRGSIVSNLRAFYKAKGFFHVKIKSTKKNLSNNRINYIFTIEEGGLSTIKKIEFEGNSFYSDGELRDVILSKEDAWWRFLSDDDVYNKGRLQADKQFLINFYRNRGFVDFGVKGVKTVVSKNKKDFFLKFSVKEGKRYKLGNLNILGFRSGMDKKRLNALLKDGSKYGYYYAKGLQNIIVNVAREMSKQGYPFVDINPVLIRKTDVNGNRVMDVNFKMVEARRIFVERIVVRGNTRTLDSVIRREIELVEGDPFNFALMRQSESNVRSLGYFSSVNISYIKGTDEKNVIVYIDIKEKSTGSLSFGAGYSNVSGVGFKISASEDNFLGRGQRTQLLLQKSGKDISVNVGFTEPRFLDRKISASIAVKRVLYDRISTKGYKAKEVALSGSLGYELNSKWYQSIGSKVSTYDLYDVKSDAIASVKSEAGRTTGFDVSYGLSYANLDNKMAPREGEKIEFNASLNSFNSKYKHSRYSLTTGYYYPLTENLVLSITGSGSFIRSYKELRMSDRLYLNTDYIRGFDKIGSIDTVTGTLLGGTTRLTVGADIDFPVGLPESMGVKGSFFVGAASLTGTPKVSSSVKLAGENVVRSSAGVGLKWQSPIGAMRFDFVRVLNKASTDSTRTFQFTVGFGL